jgi:hypothetical protein
MRQRGLDEARSFTAGSLLRGSLAGEPLEEIVHQPAQVVQRLAAGESGDEQEDPGCTALDVSHLPNSDLIFAGQTIAELAGGCKEEAPR